MKRREATACHRRALRAPGVVLALVLLLAGGCRQGDDVAGPDLAAVPGTDPTVGALPAAGNPAAGEVLRAFQCDQTSVTRRLYVMTVVGRVGPTGVPNDVRVYRTYYPQWTESYRPGPARELARTVRAVRYDVTGHPPGDPANRYTLRFPAVLPTTGTWPAMLVILFDGGRNGNQQSEQSCRLR